MPRTSAFCGIFRVFSGTASPWLPCGTSTAEQHWLNTTENLLLTKAEGVDAFAPTSEHDSPRRVLRVWVVDDNAALRELYTQLLSKQPGIRCTRQFASPEALLATLADERPPDMILLDVNLGNQCGLSAIRPIKKLAPSVKVLMLTMFSNGLYEMEAFHAGTPFRSRITFP